MIEVSSKGEYIRSFEMLRLNNELKNVIYRESDVHKLLTKACKIISKHDPYSSTWIITAHDQCIEDCYCSPELAVVDWSGCSETPCYMNALKKEELQIFRSTDDFCEGCKVKPQDDSYAVLSISLRLRGEHFGVFSVHVDARYVNDEECQRRFIELSEDISYAIYNSKLEQSLEEERQALIKSNNRFKSVVSTSSGAVIIFGIDKEVLFVSDQAMQIFGKYTKIEEKTEILGFLTEEQLNRVDERFAKLAAQEIEISKGVYEVNFPEGTKAVFKVASSLIKDPKGNPDSIISTVEDITHSHRRDIRLQEAESKFSLLFNEAPSGISLLDSQGYIIDVNEMEARILGCSREDLLGKHFKDFVREGYIDSYKEKEKEFYEQGALEEEMILVKPDGDLVYVHRSIKAVYNEGGNIEGIIVHTLDYTDVYETQKHLHTLSEVLEQSPSILTMTDLRGNLTYVNKAFEKVTGYLQEEVLGKNPRLLKSGVHDNEFYKALWSVLVVGESWENRICNRKKDGSLYYENATVGPFFDQRGRIAGYIKSGQDITALVEAEKKILESNRRYLEIFNLTPNPIVIHDNEKVVEVNDATLEFTQLETKKQLVGQNLFGFVSDEHQELVVSIIEKMQRTGEKFGPTEIILLNAKGDKRITEISGVPIDYSGEMAFMVAFQDVTERRLWTKKLEESEFKFKSIFNVNPDLIIICGFEDKCILEVNQGFQDASGYVNEEVVGLSISQLNLFADKDAEKHLLEFDTKVGGTESVELDFRKKDGGIITILASSRLIRIHEKPFLVVGAHDITERKQMEKDLLIAKEKAEENDKLKSAFLANMSHEIRTPMNAIIGFSDLLKDEGLSREEQVKYLDIIQSKSDELMFLINDILDVSKIESGALEVEVEQIEIKDILKPIKENFESLIEQKSEGRVRFVITEVLKEEVWVLADSLRLNQVFNNLISNAIKFTVEGEIRLNVDVFEDHVCFLVSDTGVGISKEKQEEIFNRFSQANARSDTLIGGTGLGLSITKSLMELMDGSISVSSEENEGSCFRVTIPRSLN